YTRVRRFYEDVLIQKEGTILIVAHKGVLQLLVSLLLSDSDGLFWNFNFHLGKYSILERYDGHCTINRLNVSRRITNEKKHHDSGDLIIRRKKYPDGSFMPDTD
ncbi:MAG TPA: hypothetical protein DHM90_04380, partial [Clostridiaceae bacterium]|nr:hypothetical protein [Clostridiaceae bacterium]